MSCLANKGTGASGGDGALVVSGMMIRALGVRTKIFQCLIRNRPRKSGALYMFQSEPSGARSFRSRFVDIPSQIGRERANPTVGYLPTSAPLLAQHNLKRTYERVQQEGESLLHPLCSPGRGSNQKRSTSTALCRCCTTRRHTRSSAPARTKQRRATKFGARKSPKIAGLQTFEHGGKAE